MTERKVTLVGAGLVGSLASMFLAKKGHAVEIYEKRRDLREKKNLLVGEGRSINLAISVRGIHALSLLGLDQKVLQQAIPMRGRMLHGRDESLTLQSYGSSDKDAINSLSRGWLNGFLMDQAEAAGVKIHFEKELEDIDLIRKKLKWKGGRESSYDLLLGTDGSASAIRRRLQMEKMTAVSSVELASSYKEFVMAPAKSSPSATPQTANGEHQMEKHALHIWPRGQFMMIALPNFDGSFTCTLFLPTKGQMSFESLQTQKDVEKLFSEEFPDFAKFVPDFAEQFFAHPTGKMFTVKTEHWSPKPHDKDVLLIGDASHAIVPFFGQGMNCGFEDCEVLLRDWESCLKNGFFNYAELRKPNTDAIADMAVENFVEMSAKTADPHFLLQKQVEKKLQEKFPQDYVSRYSLVSFSRVPYATAQKVGEIQKEILDEICQGKTRVEEVSWESAGRLIEQKLKHVFHKETSQWI